MLIRFLVSNFLSFKEETEFNMIAGSFKTHKHHVYELGKLNVLKASAIYGANGAGKSNLIKAIEYFKDLIADGEINTTISNKTFKLDVESKSLPTKFEIEFSYKNKYFAYGFTILNLDIIEEWLYEIGIKSEDKLIFERKISKNKKPLIKLSAKHMKTEKAKLLIKLMQDNLLKNNELLLCKYESFKIKEFETAFKWIKNKLITIFPISKFHGLLPVIDSSIKFKEFANRLINTFDTGVKELKIENINYDKFFGEDDESFKSKIIERLHKTPMFSFESKNGPVWITREDEVIVVKKVITTHEDYKGNSINFDIEEESDGTQRLLDFIPAFDYILNQDITIIIDEIDQSLHPALLKSLLFKTMADTSSKGQLIFSTHQCNLLDLELLRQDEIWFAEKDRTTGASRLYSLSEFKPRYDLDIEKGYLKGRFGGIPFLANLNDLNWNKIDEEEKGLQ